MLALEDKWAWDFWLVRDNETWHLFFLQAPKAIGDPDLRHWNVTFGHAVSTDLRNWTCLREAFAPSRTPAWDDYTVWTGSVVRDDSDLWHLFYTGTSKAENGLKQRIGHATSADLLNWRRCGDGLALDIDPAEYEEYTPGHWHDRALRDPWVMRDPSGNGWIMYFTARAPGGGEANNAGAIGFARSNDLHDWKSLSPVYSGCFGQLEVPQVLEFSGRWYCLFSTDAQHWSHDYRSSYPGNPVSGTHYLVADSHLGPWSVAEGPFLDGSKPPCRYAGKIIETESGHFYMGFLHDGPNGEFIGAVSDPVPIAVTRAGRLALLPANEKT